MTMARNERDLGHGPMAMPHAHAAIEGSGHVLALSDPGDGGASSVCVEQGQTQSRAS